MELGLREANEVHFPNHSLFSNFFEMTTQQESIQSSNWQLLTTIVGHFERYGYGFNAVFTFFGNTLNILTLTRPKMRQHSLHVYMMVLALADMTFTLTGLVGRIWSHILFGTDWPSLSEISCQIWVYILNVSEGSSSWVLACMSCERCLAILMPLKARTFISRKATCVVLSIVHLALGAFHSYAFILCDVKTIRYCFFKDNIYSDILKVHFVPAVNLYIPSCIIFMCNIILIVTLIKAKSRRVQALNVSKEKSSTSSKTFTLILVATAFFALKAPRKIYASSNLSQFPDKVALDRLLLALVLWLSYFNHSINIILYVASSPQFRSELKNLLISALTCCCLRK